MDRYWEANSAAQAPAVPVDNAGGFPTDGSLPAAIAPTTPGAWWFHSITEELRHAIVALGASPDYTQVDQLAQALLAALAHLAVSIRYEDVIGTPVPLGFTPVEQGGGVSQGVNKVHIGWRTNGSGLGVTVDQTDEGNVVFEAELQGTVNNLQNNINNVNNAVNDLRGQVGGAWTPANLQPLSGNGIGWVAFIVRAGDSSQSAPEGTVAALPGRPGTWLSSGNASAASDYWGVWTRIA
ncbi:hypothetical protein HDG34_002554 [Paraburkholderia sp. HC6.4b]|uniref:hypothetical protein n=1 Tax=unclassified Paraburkholderia TaxID=2615204 RepID=UPI001610CD93|nr:MULTISPECIES: hypothetical protein [unclassified Paraburkholderia]MBB5408617.1 hypothetical protein [Paraburkholderia sp. HC6.4b]MBB5450449.1 hypothetical protein [Paraburkholderia sp. Kb1A]